MNLFLELIQKLKKEFPSDLWKKTLITYLNSLSKEEIHFALKILSGEKWISISLKEMKETISEYLQIPIWMIEECKNRFGSYSHTFSLLFPEPKEPKSLSLSEWKKEFLDPIEEAHSSLEIRNTLIHLWSQIPDKERNLFHRLILKGKNTVLPAEIIDYCKNIYKESFENELWKVEISRSNKEEIRTKAKLALGYVKKSIQSSHEYEEFSFLAKTKEGNWIKTASVSGWKPNESDSPKLAEFIKENQIQKFGPVLSLKLKLICEISFLDVETSKRHKSGLKLISPRLEKILWEEDISLSNDLTFFQNLLKKEY